MMTCPSPTVVSSIIVASNKTSLSRLRTSSPLVHASNGSDCKAEASTATPCVSAAIQVSPNEAFMKFLQMAQVELGRVTVQCDLFTMQQIFDIIRDYIRNRRLFDPKDPTIVHCGQDSLGQVFGVDQFTKFDVLNLIHKNTTKSGMSSKIAKSVPRSEEELVSSTTEADNVRKRHVDVDIETSPCRKKIMFEDCSEQNENQSSEVCAKLTTSSDVISQQTSNSLFSLRDLLAFSVATMTNVEYDSDIETVFSIQSKVTDIVKDSTDDLWFLETDEDNEYNAIFGESSDNDVYANELELLSEPDYAAEHSDSDECIIRSRTEDIIIICESESDLEFFADCEDDDDDESDELSDDDLSSDKWTCSNCDTINCAIRRFCDFCWTLRPDWLKGKSQGKEESSASALSLPSPVPAHCLTSPLPALSLPSLVPADNSEVVTDSLNASTSCSTVASECLINSTNCPREAVDCSNVTQNCAIVTIDSLNVAVDCKTDFSISDLTETNVESMVVKKTELQTLAAESQPNSGLCVICLGAPKDASIVHGSTGHQACCFDCAKQLKSRRQPCPVCRRPIHKVIRNYFV